MKLATTTADCNAFCPDPVTRIRELRNAGFRHADLSLYSPEAEDSWMRRSDWQDTALKLKACTADIGIDFVQAHSPGGNPLGSPEEQDRIVADTIRSIEICGALGIPVTVVHSGMRPGLDRREYYRENLAFYQRLFPAMEKYGVFVCIENSTKANMGDMYYFLTGADMREFCEESNHPLMGGCWDTGHANCEGHQYQDLIDLGPRLKAVHINDNRGHLDEHLIPWCGTCAFDEVMAGLLDAKFDGPFTLESSSTLRPARYWLGNRTAYAKDHRIENAPAEMYPLMEKALYIAGRFMLESYHCFDD